MCVSERLVRSIFPHVSGLRLGLLRVCCELLMVEFVVWWGFVCLLEICGINVS